MHAFIFVAFCYLPVPVMFATVLCPLSMNCLFPLNRRNNESIFEELQSQDTDLIGEVDFGITGKMELKDSIIIIKY